MQKSVKSEGHCYVHHILLATSIIYYFQDSDFTSVNLSLSVHLFPTPPSNSPTSSQLLLHITYTLLDACLDDLGLNKSLD